ncbi:MAG: hypothetical protein AAF664_20280 [Planctomycetota bacterium]
MWKQLLFAIAVSNALPSANADLVTYVYTGSNFTTVGLPFTTADAVTGTMTIDTPMLPGTLNGVGNITSIEFSASIGGDPGFTFAGLDDAFFPSSWFFTFDGAGDITDWALAFSGDVTGNPNLELIYTSTIGRFGPEGSFARLGTDGGGFTEGSATGTWSRVTAVPEPTSFVYVALTATLVGVGYRRQRFAG